MRARILSGVATLVVACALNTPEASAQVIGTCPGLTPPPCIITDPGRIAGTVAEIAQKKMELEAAIQQVREYTTLNGVLGKVGVLPDQLKAAILPPANQAFDALTEPMTKVTISQAANTLDAVISAHPQTVEGKSEAHRENQLRLRAAGGESYAMAAATKYKLCKMNQEARKLTTQMQNVDNSAAGTDIRGNWAINQGARRLVFDGLLAYREVQTARLQLKSLQSIPTTGGSPRTRTEAPPATSEASPEFANTIGTIANVATKLAALIAAREVIGSFLDGIKGAKDTKAEYEQMKNAATQAQNRVQAIANDTARRKGVSAATLMTIANQQMQARDRTTWDNPSKVRAAKDAANAAEAALDKRVNGDVQNNWSDFLVQRAEAYKQEAFFRPIAQDADQMEKQTIQALAEYEQSLGLKASDPAVLNAAITASQAELDQLKQGLASAPPAVIHHVNQLLTSTGVPAMAGVPSTNK